MFEPQKPVRLPGVARWLLIRLATYPLIALAIGQAFVGIAGFGRGIAAALVAELFCAFWIFTHRECAARRQLTTESSSSNNADQPRIKKRELVPDVIRNLGSGAHRRAGEVAAASVPCSSSCWLRSFRARPRVISCSATV